MPFAPHPDCLAPDTDQLMAWRYTDLSKFLWLLERRTLHLCRLDRLEDTFEGTLPGCLITAVEAANSSWYNAETNFKQTLPARIASMTRNLVFVNCWHVNEYESAAMWQLYGAQHGIAIQSTYGRIKRALKGFPGDVNIGLVRYIDFTKQTIDPYSVVSLATTKRKSFEHERELRILASPDPNDPKIDRKALELGLPTTESIVVPIDPDELIERVHISPAMPEWCRELVETLCRRYDLKQEVIHSGLYSRPML